MKGLNSLAISDSENSSNYNVIMREEQFPNLCTSKIINSIYFHKFYISAIAKLFSLLTFNHESIEWKKLFITFVWKEKLSVTFKKCVIKGKDSLVC